MPVKDQNYLLIHYGVHEVHEGVNQKYTTRILSKERNLLPLTIKEGLYIERQVPQTTMNDRNEFRRGSLIRLTAELSVT